MIDRRFDEMPPTYETYAKIIKSLVPILNNKPLSNKQKESETLPEATYGVDKLEIDLLNLQDYRRICGFADNGQVPPTYFAVLSQTLQMTIMADEPFPFAMLGLVHIQNSVTQYRRIDAIEEVSMTVSLANLRDHDKGKQFDFVTKVHADKELIWEGTSTYLSRQKVQSEDENKTKPSKSMMPKPTPSENGLHHIFAVPEDIGRRYAKISGDFNLIHLHALTAKALGFPKAIAHGMWSKAKCLSLMDLPDTYTVDVAFKLPIYLPSEVELIGDSMRELDKKDAIDFGLYSAKNDKPHLTGTIKKID